MTNSRAPTRSAFSYRAFTMFLIGRIVSILSFQMLVVAIGWQLYTLTDSALDLGLLGIAQFVPMFVLTPLVGHAVDRYDNRVILLICQLGEAAAAAILALGTMTGQLDPLTIYVIIALVGAGAPSRSRPWSRSSRRWCRGRWCHQRPHGSPRQTRSD